METVGMRINQSIQLTLFIHGKRLSKLIFRHAEYNAP